MGEARKVFFSCLWNLWVCVALSLAFTSSSIGKSPKSFPGKKLRRKFYLQQEFRHRVIQYLRKLAFYKLNQYFAYDFRNGETEFLRA